MCIIAEMKHRLFLIPLFTGLLLYGCGDSDDSEALNPNGAVEPSGETEGQDITTGDGGGGELYVWEEEPTEYPDGLVLEYFEEDLGGGNVCKGYRVYVNFDENPLLRFNAYHHIPKLKPTEIYEDFDRSRGWPFIVINGGFFAGTTSFSLAVVDGHIRALNYPSINWPSDSNYQRTVYPVRSALGQMEDGSFEIHWTYPAAYPSFREHYSFLSALDNDEESQTFMDAAPTVDTPGAELWKPVEAIGGGPRLVKDGENVARENYWKEVLDGAGVSGLSRQPRTAIGVTLDNNLILIVCDGRNMNGSVGYTLPELADRFIELGADNAFNLDGGGSTQIVGLGGEILNRPSDSGTTGAIVERTVVTAVVISAMHE